MKTKLLLMVAMMFTMLSSVFAQENEEAKKKINSIKKNNRLYIYAEATAATPDEAANLAEEILYEEINSWVASKKNLRNSANIVVNNKTELWTAINHPRGNMFRSFIYVKKSDILPADNVEVIANNPVTDPLVSTVEIILPEAVQAIVDCTQYNEMAAKVKQLKVQGEILDYNRYGQLQEPEQYYLAIYNKEGQVVAVLSPGEERQNVKTGKVDSVANYSGCGAIGFKIK